MNSVCITSRNKDNSNVTTEASTVKWWYYVHCTALKYVCLKNKKFKASFFYFTLADFRYVS